MIIINPECHRAFWRGDLIPLTLAEYKMVELIFLNKDVTYQQLWEAIHKPGWQAGTGPDGYKGNVRSFIKRIRRKFEKIDPKFNAITNYYNVGYRWEPK